jgi:hypothetical protein
MADHGEDLVDYEADEADETEVEAQKVRSCS